MPKRYRNPESVKRSEQKRKDRYHSDPKYRERILAKVKKYKEKHRDKVLACHKNWKAKNPNYVSPFILDGRMKEWQRNHRKNNRDHYKKKSKKWRDLNPEKVRIIDRNKKIRRKNVEGKHTLADIKRIAKMQKDTCALCSTRFNIKDRSTCHVDHIIPLKRGGTNWPKNLQILCPSCNLRKRDKDPIDFAQEIGLLI